MPFLTILPQLFIDSREPVVALDIETTGLSIFADDITAIAVATEQLAVVVDVRGMDRQRVAEWLRSAVYPNKVVVHNGQFDLTFIKQYYGVDYPTSLFDTMIGETLLTAGLYDIDDEDGEIIGPMSRGLQAAVMRRLGVEVPKEEEVRLNFKLDNEWTEGMADYAANDAALLLPLYREQRKKIITEGMAKVARVEMACVPIFCEMQRRGVVVDTQRLNPLIDEATAAAANIEKRLQTLLTPYLYWGRMRKQEGADAELAKWRRRYDSQEQSYLGEWLAYHTFPEWQDALRKQWVGEVIPGSAKPITAEEVETWLDERAPKGKPYPAGLSRFVKRMMQDWRTQEGNQRPPHLVVDINKPLNIRSVPEKTEAIAAYLASYNQAHRTELVPPENLQRKTLVAYSVDAPTEVNENLITPLTDFSKLDKLVTAFGPPLAQLLRGQDPYTVVEEVTSEGPRYTYDDDDNEVLAHVEMVTEIVEKTLFRSHSLHGGYRQCGTATGRPTCQKPNLLQMPTDPRFRSCFRSREGYKFIVADFSQIELRILAEMSGDPELRRAFAEGLDLHSLTAIKVLGADAADVADKLRKLAKVLNFGIVYGMRENAYRRQLAGQKIFVSKAEASAHLGGWRSTYRKAATTIEGWGQRAVAQGYAETALGRRRYFDIPKTGLAPFQRGKIEREGANHPIQGTSADITKLAMALAQPELLNLGGSILLQVYDELVSEVPEQHAERAAEVVRAAMEMAAKSVLKTVPCKVDCCVSPSWNEKEGS